MTTRPSGDAALTATVLDRLARGFDHRLNNIVTILTIAAQQVGEAMQEEAAAQLREVLLRSTEQLGLLQDMLGNDSPRADVNRAARAVASIAGGLDHRLVVTTAIDPGETIIDVSSRALIRLLSTAALIVHASAPQGGTLSFVVSRAASTGTVQIVGRPTRGTLVALPDLPPRAQQDLEHMRAVAARVGYQLSIRGAGDQLTLSLCL